MIDKAKEFGWYKGMTGVFEVAHEVESIGNESCCDISLARTKNVYSSQYLLEDLLLLDATDESATKAKADS